MERESWLLDTVLGNNMFLNMLNPPESEGDSVCMYQRSIQQEKGMWQGRGIGEQDEPEEQEKKRRVKPIWEETEESHPGDICRNTSKLGQDSMKWWLLGENTIYAN